LYLLIDQPATNISPAPLCFSAVGFPTASSTPNSITMIRINVSSSLKMRASLKISTLSCCSGTEVNGEFRKPSVIYITGGDRKMLHFILIIVLKSMYNLKGFRKGLERVQKGLPYNIHISIIYMSYNIHISIKIYDIYLANKWI